MTMNISNGLIGLSMLSGSNSLLTFGGSFAAIETRAVRQAKALFTTPATTPPWKTAAPATPVSTQVSAVKRMATIIDKAATGTAALPEDVQTAFTTYKALDRLRILAETAAKTGTSAAERTSLQTSFAKGLADLQGFLSTAPSDALQLSFAQPARRAESVAMVAPASLLVTEVAGRAVAEARDAPLAGLTGTERFRITLSKTGGSDSVEVDLSGTPQPPTLDSVAAAINTAIAAVPMRNPDGSVATDAQGNTVPRWLTRFVPDKSTDGWGFSIERGGLEKVEIDQIGAGDALMIATNVTAPGAVVTTRLMRFDDPAGAMTRQTLGMIAAVDRDATERAALVAATTATSTTAKTEPADVAASTTAGAIATDAQGFSYVVGTASGDLGANLSDGGDDLVLSKLDSEGKLVWQRSLGASGSAKGAAVSIGSNGEVVVAGTVTGSFGTAASDGDMLVARFDANGDEKFATLVRTVGADSASAVAIAADGSIFVGGKAATGNGDAFIARLDATGRLTERRLIDSGGTDGVTALAIDASGELLALTREGTEAKLRRIDSAALSTDLGTLALGTADARALAVDADGSIAVAGATIAALPGAQVNARGGGRDGFVARIDAALSGASVTYLASAGDDQVDSVQFMNGAIYAGGRTTGGLGGTQTGAVDGFVTRLDAATGTVGTVTQFGQAAQRTEPVRLAAVKGGDTVLGALGLRRGAITPQDSAKLVAQTSLRAGDSFSIRVNDGALRKIVITADDTLTTLADRIRLITSSKATIGTPKSGDGNVLRIDAKPGTTIELIAGADGSDALAKLGLPAARITAPAAVPTNAPKVRPGGRYGLDLTEALNLGTTADAAVALTRVKQAISISQTGYRSLYWDDGKAALVNGVPSGGTGSTGRINAQLAQYQAALDRLSTPGSTGFLGF